MDFKKFELTESEINKQCRMNLTQAYAKIDEENKIDREIKEMLRGDEFE